MGSSFDAPTNLEEVENDDEYVNITVSMFFDGTQNNMKNTEARLEYEKKIIYDETIGKINSEPTAEQSKILKEKRYDATKADYYVKVSDKKGDSYMNDYSNVARLFQYYEEEESKPDDLRVCIYIEGIGTADYKKDEMISSGTGKSYIFGWEGIVSKVDKGFKELKETILRLNPKKKKIKQLNIDVFGFSRGAAAARNFIHKILEGKSFYRKIDLKAFFITEDIECESMNMRFAGLFDTVSSYGIYFRDNNVKELNLDAVNKVDHALHLTAADEHRKYFPLIKIASATANGRIKEVALPGVHSDIGGCYVDGAEEIVEGIMKGTKSQLYHEINRLESEGWYIKKELEIIENSKLNIYRKDADKEGYLRGTRTLSNLYSFIPLHIMCDHAMKKAIGVTFKVVKLKKKLFIPDKAKYHELKQIETLLYNEVLHGGRKIIFISREKLKTKINTFWREKECAGAMSGKNKGTERSTLEDLSLQIDHLDVNKELNPATYADDKELKQQIEDHNLLKNIRNKHLHWSASGKLGMGGTANRIRGEHIG